MRKEMLCVLGVLLGGCWAQAQQMPYGYAAPAYYQGYPQMAPSMPAYGWPAANGAAGGYNYPANYANAQYAPMNNGYGMNYPYAQGVPPALPPQAMTAMPMATGPVGDPVVQGELPTGTTGGDPAIATGGFVPTNRSMWVSVDYFLAHLQRDRLTNPLVTLGDPADAHPGALGQPGTRVLFGNNEYRFDTRQGIRAAGGIYLDSAHAFSVDLGGFYVFPEELRSTFASDPNGNPLIARPVLNALVGQLRSFLTTSPGTFAGSTTVEAKSEMWGAEANARYEFDLAPSVRANVLGGVRFLRLRERLAISDQITPLQDNILTFLGPANFVNSPNSIQDQDVFETTNSFYGINLGSQVRWQNQWVSLTAFGKVALGSTDEKLRIQGTTTLVTPAGNQVAPGGVLALPSNIGNYSRSVFGVVPEAGLTLGIEPIQHVRATLGYSFLYWNNVLRPGNQIDRIVNPGQVPTDVNFGVNNAGPHPIVDLSDRSFRVHTLNIGLELYY